LGKIRLDSFGFPIQPLYPRPTAKTLDGVFWDVGCGDNKVEGTTGIDIVPGEQVDIVADAREIIAQAADNDLDGIICYDFLEHLSPEDAKRFLRHAQRVLKPLGRLWLRVPDLPTIVEVFRRDFVALSKHVAGAVHKTEMATYYLHKSFFTRQIIEALLLSVQFAVATCLRTRGATCDSPGTNILVLAEKLPELPK